MPVEVFPGFEDDIEPCRHLKSEDVFGVGGDARGETVTPDGENLEIVFNLPVGKITACDLPFCRIGVGDGIDDSDAGFLKDFADGGLFECFGKGFP